jgi:hypothetical protein
MKTFSTSIVNPGELHTAATTIDQIILTDIPTDAFVKKIEPLLKPQLNNLSLSLGRITDSTNIRILFDQDAVRDARFKTLRDYCKVYAGDKDTTLATSGKMLVSIFKELGWSMNFDGYAEESSELNALLGQLAKAPGSTAIAAIGATSRLADLKTAQTDFETTYNEKVSAQAKVEYPKIYACRVAISRYLNGLLSYIDLTEEVDKGNYTIAANKIDEVITEFEAKAHSRQTRIANKDKKSTDSSTTTTK